VSDALPDGFVLDDEELPDGFVVDESKPSSKFSELQNSGSDLLRNYYGAMLEPIASMGSGMFATPLAGIAGIGARGLEAAGVIPQNSGSNTVEAVRNAMTYKPRTEAGQKITDALAMPFEKLANVADAAGQAINDLAGSRISPVAAQYGLDPLRIPEEGNPAAATFVNTAIQSIPAVLLRGRAKPAEVSGNVSRPSPMGRGVVADEATQNATSTGRQGGLAPVSKAPSKADLKKSAEAAYKRADESGVVVTPESFSTLKTRIAADMQKQGIDPALHPDSSAALRRITDKNGSLTLQELETLRRIANDAEGSIKPADRRLAGRMVDEIDDYIDSLTERDVVAGDAAKGKALKEARSLYSRAKKAEELDNLMERAELSAPNFSGSGMENAIRTEFRNLAKNERRMRRFTREEQEAIKRVAKGGPVENTLRMLGKLAPTGVVSSALSSGAGFVTGGPIGAVAFPAAGALGRYMASRMTAGNAARANELVRRGPPLPQPQLPGGITPVLSPDQIGMLGR